MNPPEENLQTIQHPSDLAQTAIESETVRTLCRVRSGELMAELDEDIRDLIKACQDTGKKGTVTITLTFKPNGAGKMAIKDVATLKAPQPEQRETFLFTAKGQLLTQDPEQMTMGPILKMPEPERPVVAAGSDS